jgi:hypothetical protein
VCVVYGLVYPLCVPKSRSVKFVCFFKSQKVLNGFVEHFGIGFSRVLDARGHAKA